MQFLCLCLCCASTPQSQALFHLSCHVCYSWHVCQVFTSQTLFQVLEYKEWVGPGSAVQWLDPPSWFGGVGDMQVCTEVSSVIWAKCSDRAGTHGRGSWFRQQGMRENSGKWTQAEPVQEPFIEKVFDDRSQGACAVERRPLKGKWRKPRSNSSFETLRSVLFLSKYFWNLSW
jgi:hypothetical protein